ncbi:unnamed protein product [Rotaria sordida]|uniref:Sodefrin repeats C n=1 Tax=Rotaria sordida TaxID=392033 RepID=A0A814JIB7_9BILA|nr:unnamed protein product [Rotaria sordida]CAF1038031.1 unnamed protein product [Rotaria sordida]
MGIVIPWIFLVLVIWAAPSTSLICYQCWCPSFNTAACNCSNTSDVEGSHCIIVEEFHSSNPYIELSSTFLDSSYIRLKDSYYIILDESIFYHEITKDLKMKTKRIVYGCDWNYCNEYSLISLLPDSFKLTMDKKWFEENIYGNGSVNACHTCSKEICGNRIQPISYDQSTFTPCNNPTTCSLYNVWHDVETDESCYRSECTKSVFKDDPNEDNQKYKVQVEAIVYLSQIRSNLEIWKLNINCAVYNCTRSSIFQDVKEQIRNDINNLMTFPTVRRSPIDTSLTIKSAMITIPTTTPTLSCYECACYNDPACSCNTVRPDDASSTYCIIIRRNNESGDFTVNLEHIDRNSSRVFIRKFPYLLAEESILYNETTKEWTTRTNTLVYGCNWNLCNHPSLVTLIPDSFKMTLSDEWLNANVLDSGASDRDCHECPQAPQCGTTEFIDASRCPIKPCNSTCVVVDKFDNPTTNEFCYQSYCSSPEADIEENQHRVELEGIIYGDQPDVVELWEIDLYCRADDCSRVEIFQEIRENLTVETNNLTLLLDNSSRPIVEPEIICYDCFCYDDPICACDKYTVSSASSSYCTIIRDNFDEDFFIALEHIDRNSTFVYIREFPYLLVEESIIYDEKTGWWNTRNNVVIFGCNWNYCNDPRLIPHLPNSFQMRLPETWLDSNILGTGQPVRECHECPNAPQCGTTEFLNTTECPIQPCNTTCLVSDIFDDPAIGLLCYQSFCAPPDSEFFTIDPHRVELDGVIYGSRPRSVELWEIHIFCRADDCSRPELFKEIRQNLCVDLGDYTIFLGNTSTVGQGNETAICPATTTNRTTTLRTTTSVITVSGTTTSSITGSGTTTSRMPTSSITNATTSTERTTIIPGTTTSFGQTTTGPPEITTTAESGLSINVAHNIFILFFLLISLINLY